MSTPSYIAKGIALMEDERRALASRLDAIDLALLNLRLIWPGESDAPAKRKQRALKAAKRQKRAATAAVDLVGGTSDRDEAILKALRRNGGLGTAKELRKAMPVDGMTEEQATRAFGNAMQRLKNSGLVDRTGHTWSLVGAGSEAES